MEHVPRSPACRDECRDEWLTGAIRAIGGPDFADRLYGGVHRRFGVDHVVLFVFRSDDRSGLVATTGKISPALADRLGRAYAEESWFRRDPNLPLIRVADAGFGAMDRALCARRYGREYWRRFFGAARIVDKVALSVRADEDAWIYANFHRLAESGPFSPQERAELLGHGSVLSSLLARHWQLLSRTRRLAPVGPAFRTLSPRERQVCEGILSGLTLKGVAQALGVSLNTVTTLRRRAFARLGIRSGKELVRLSLTQD